MSKVQISEPVIIDLRDTGKPRRLSIGDRIFNRRKKCSPKWRTDTKGENGDEFGHWEIVVSDELHEEDGVP